MNNDERDRRCVARCCEGDTDAFGELVDRYQRPVFNAVYRMVGEYEETSDLTQQIFIRAWSSLGQFERDRRFFSWLYRIAMNETINFLKSRRQFEPLDPGLANRSPGPHEALAAEETRTKIGRALTQLTVDSRLVVILRHYLDCSYAEAAEILEIPEKTVKSRLFSARKRLREILIDEAPTRGRA